MSGECLRVAVEVRGEGRDRELAFTLDRTLSIGRDPDCDLRLASPRVSRWHLSLFVRQGRLQVRDHSSNGTTVDGERLCFAVREVGSTARLEVGPYALSLRLLGPDASESVSGTRALRPSARRRPAKRNVLFAVAALTGALSLTAPMSDAAFGAAPESIAEREPFALVSPIPPLPTRCRLAGEEAVRHARFAEAMARACWERVPFAPEEASRALSQIIEAELCYGALDREGRLRSSAQRREYEAEITRRFARSRLLLRVAVREGKLADARRQIAILRALLSRASEEAQAYRSELAQLDRAFEAEQSERARRESTPLPAATRQRARMREEPQ